MSTEQKAATQSSWSAYLKLKEKVTASGLDKPTPVLSLSIFALHTVCLFGGLVPLAFYGWSVWAVLGLLVSTYGCLGISTSGHVASHHTLTYHRGWDRFFTYFGFTVLLGVSEHFWREKHVRTHHAHPNHVGLDQDINMRPFFIITPDEKQNLSGFYRWYLNHQHWMIVPALAGNAINVQREGWTYLARALWQRPTERELWVDAFCIALHFTIWLVIPMFFWAPGAVIGVYLLRKVLMGFAMFSAFAPAHFPPEAEIIAGPPGEIDHVTRQLYTTVNFRTNLIGRIVCSGVDFQIEHHLLPTANQYRFHKLQPLVQEFCREHGHPYHSYSWWNGIVESLRSFKTLKRVVPVEEIRNKLPTGSAATPAVTVPALAAAELDPSF